MGLTLVRAGYPKTGGISPFGVSFGHWCIRVTLGLVNPGPLEFTHGAWGDLFWAKRRAPGGPLSLFPVGVWGYPLRVRGKVPLVCCAQGGILESRVIPGGRDTFWDSLGPWCSSQELLLGMSTRWRFPQGEEFLVTPPKIVLPSFGQSQLCEPPPAEFWAILHRVRRMALTSFPKFPPLVGVRWVSENCPGCPRAETKHRRVGE